MVSIQEALDIVLKNTKCLGSEKVALTESLDRVLAEDIKAREELPPFDKSAMDGYALKAEDTADSLEFRICGVVPAGTYHAEEIKKGEAIKIMTGAALPPGTNAVIQIEKVKVEGDKLILEEPLKPNLNVLLKGEEIQIGDLAIEKGTLIRPTEIGVLASLGYSEVPVYKKPKLALLITGSELVAVEETPGPGKIRNSNEYSLMALAQKANVDFVSYGIIVDEIEVLREKMREAFEEADIILTTGGASVGDYDFVADVLEEIGAKSHFQKVAVKPGKPVIFATKGEKIFFGMPGNPMAVVNSFQNFVMPAINGMIGNKEESYRWIDAVLADEFKIKKGRTQYIYVNLKWEDGHYVVRKLHKKQSSNYLLQMSRANGVLVIPGDKGLCEVGEVMKARFLFA